MSGQTPHPAVPGPADRDALNDSLAAGNETGFYEDHSRPEQAMERATADDRDRPMYANTAGMCHLTRWGLAGDDADLRRAMRLIRIAAAAKKHPEYAGYLGNVLADLPADAQATEPVQQRQGPLHHPAQLPDRSGA